MITPMIVAALKLVGPFTVVSPLFQKYCTTISVLILINQKNVNWYWLFNLLWYTSSSPGNYSNYRKDFWKNSINYWSKCVEQIKTSVILHHKWNWLNFLNSMLRRLDLHTRYNYDKNCNNNVSSKFGDQKQEMKVIVFLTLPNLLVDLRGGFWQRVFFFTHDPKSKEMLATVLNSDSWMVSFLVGSVDRKQSWPKNGFWEYSRQLLFGKMDRWQLQNFWHGKFQQMKFW